MSAFLIICTALVSIIIIRLSQILPMFSRVRKTKVKKNVKGEKQVSTMIIWGSGGHTTEMVLLLKSFSAQKFGPIHCVLAQTDTTSYHKVQTNNLPILQQATWHRVIRSREVKQSYLTTLLTVLLSVFHSIWIILILHPQLIVCNGPGTCVPLCYGAFLLRLIGLTNTKIVFCESFCRVEGLSLTGKLLYPITDKFIVQWPELSNRYSRAEYLGDLD